MKRLFKIVIIFFALALSLLFEPGKIQVQTIDSVGYIQSVKNESVVLVSNNIFNGEINSYQEEENQNFSGNSPLLVSYLSKKENFSKNKAHVNGCFIHNLSANNQKIHQIRAP